MENKIRIVIGSWGSYNECNERALGSKWLTLNDYSSWEEIEEELIKEGFELNGIDEELFIQDIEGIYSDSASWDYINSAKLGYCYDRNFITYTKLILLLIYIMLFCHKKIPPSLFSEAFYINTFNI